MLSKTLGQRIRELRLQKGMTQIDLASDICTPSMISQIESDRAKPSYKTLAHLSERLEVPLETLLSNVDLNLEQISTYKMAKAMLLAKEYETALPLFDLLLQKPNAMFSKQEIQYSLAECLMNLGKLDEAEQIFNEVLEGSIFRQDSLLILKTFQSHGIIETKRGQYQLAVYYFKKALEMAAKLENEDIFLKSGIFVHLGNVNDRLGKIQESISYYANASSLLEKAGTMEDIAMVYMKLGQSYKSINELDKATEYSERAASILEGVENVYMGLKVQLNTAIAYGKAGREEEAMKLLVNVINKFTELGKNEETGVAYVEMAKVHLKMGWYEAAEGCCHSARSLLPPLHLYQAWVNRVLAKVEMEYDNKDDAIRHFQKSADCFKSQGKIGEWAETMTELSHLKIQENDMSGAISIMEKIQLETQNVLSERGIVL